MDFSLTFFFTYIMNVTSCLHFEYDQYFGNYDIIEVFSMQHMPSSEVDVTFVLDDILYFFFIFRRK